jgi:uncharacterized RDD family membrane protein YckC
MNTPPDEPQTAGFSIRVVAHLFDTFLLFAFVLGPLMSIFGVELGPLGPLVNLALAVFVVYMWRTRGGTPGKLLLGLRVVDAATLGPLSTPQAVGRYLAYLIYSPLIAILVLICFGVVLSYPSSLLFVLLSAPVLAFLLLGWITVDRRNQAWHDKLTGTLVIYAPRRPKEPALVETAKVVEPG